MNAHPGGREHTERMLALAALPSGARVLDLGAGAGDTVALLREKGYAAAGVDLTPGGEGVAQGDLLHTGLAAGSFDALISQCTFYLSGDAAGAFMECHRLLRPGGTLMVSDVCFAPLRPLAEAAGFTVTHQEDLTALWREYYIEAIWNGTAQCLPVRGKCTYEILICVKE